MASKDSSNGTRTCVDTKSVPSCVVLSSPLGQVPFLRPTLDASVPLRMIRELHCSIASKTDDFFRFVDMVASQNQILRKISSVSSDFNDFTQVVRRNHRNANSSLACHNFAAILPSDSTVALVVSSGFQNFLNLYNTVLVCRLVLTWFPNTPPAIVGPLSTICDPYLNLFRGIIPPLGGTLDLSPILAFLALDVFTNSAAALPAELPKTESSQDNLSLSSHTSRSTSEDKWMTRLRGSRSKQSCE